MVELRINGETYVVKDVFDITGPNQEIVKKISDMLKELSLKRRTGRYDPFPLHTLCTIVASNLGGEVVSYTLPKFIPNRIY